MKELKIEDLQELGYTYNVEIKNNCIQKVLKNDNKFYAYLPYFDNGRLFEISEKIANLFIKEKELKIVYLKWKELRINGDNTFISDTFEIETKNSMDYLYFGK